MSLHLFPVTYNHPMILTVDNLWNQRFSFSSMVMLSPTPTACHLGGVFISAFQFKLNCQCISYLSLHNRLPQNSLLSNTNKPLLSHSLCGSGTQDQHRQRHGDTTTALVLPKGKAGGDGRHWLMAILKSSGIQAIPDSNSKPGSAL